ncbi:MAG: methionine--tRNA ligase [bacterium]|nr:methionine--tRNA ligase [bacterium]
MKFTLTTPIYYINDKPHIGHAYTTIVADIIARYHRLKGEDVFFLTGTDENSQKNIEAAEKLGKGDRIQEYLDEQSAVWRSTWEKLGITNTDFIRTTESRHIAGVEKFFNAVYERGDIYKGTYRGYYCAGCEAFVNESDLVDGLCPLHKKKPDTIEEENYFFSASKYRDALLEHIEKHPEFVQPQSRRNEIINYIQNHFTDISISRQSLKWGIPLPIDKTHVVYVWFDALINYLTGIGYGTNDEMFEKYWPAELHLVGKDIIKFHCALWPAMLMSAGLPLPKQVFAHGFFTIDGDKISKSLGNSIDPVEIANQYGRDPLRYFLVREIPFGSDGDFSFTRLKERYTSDLAKGLGNFVSRVVALAAKDRGEQIDEHNPDEDEVKKIASATWDTWETSLQNYEFGNALDAIWHLISWGDTYIEKTKPWALAKENRARYRHVIDLLLELVRHTSLLIQPFLPETTTKITEQLVVIPYVEALSSKKKKEWHNDAVVSVKRGTALFPPLDV